MNMLNSIKYKLILMVVLIQVFTLMIILVININITFKSQQNDIINASKNIATVFGKLNTAALVFNDNETAKDSLNNLKYDANIESACLYNASGVIFAKYISDENDDDDDDERHCTELLNDKYKNEDSLVRHLGDEDWLITQKIIDENDEFVGYIVIVSDTRSLNEIVKDQLITETLIVILVLFLSLLLAIKIQQYIVSPIEKLSNTASRISNELDYSIRAKKYSDDEVGSLTDAINKMLEIIEKSTKDLEGAKEAAEEANKAKSEFLSNMSRELRTPMHAILRFSQNGMEEIETSKRSELKEYFEDISISGKRLTKLINNLLTLSKYSSGRTIVEFNEGSIKAPVEHAIRELKSLCEEKKLSLKIDIEDNLHNVRFDYDMIVQVVVNLLSNAIKFSPEGKEIHVNVCVYKEKVPGEDKLSIDAVKCSVADQGVGIPEEELETIFNQFVQSSVTNTGAGGTGLGLAICKQIVELHYGRIWAENNQYGGATVSFIIPIA